MNFPGTSDPTSTSSMSVRPLILFVSLLLAGIPVECRGQNTEVVGDKTAATEAVGKLVDQLALPRFSDRQKATEEILKLDASSVPLLQASMETATGETGARLRLILPVLRRRLFDMQLDRFSKNPSVETVRQLPDWSRFAAIAGDDTNALTVFREILRAERTLFAMRMFSAPDFPAALEERSTAFAELCNGRPDEQFPIATCAALMLLGSEPATTLKGVTAANISRAFEDTRFGHLVDNSQQTRTLQAIIGAWMIRPGIAPDRPLLFAMEHNLSAGRPLAHQIIRSGVSNQKMYYALLLLAKLKNPEDLAIVKSVLESNTQLWPPRDKNVRQLLPGTDKPNSFSVQTRDVALAVAIHLQGLSPEEFGMNVLPSELTVFIVHSMGFDDDNARNEVFAKYSTAFPDAPADSNGK